jgi:hypothetical protein
MSTCNKVAFISFIQFTGQKEVNVCWTAKKEKFPSLTFSMSARYVTYERRIKKATHEISWPLFE